MNILQKLVIYGYSLILALLPTPRYVEGVVGQPQSFLPSHTKNQIDRTISSLVYRGLFKYDIYGATVPDLADTWTVSADGLVYTIKLKDNQRWTDGRKITADDLIYTSFKVSDLSGVATDKVDELTVRYTLPNKYAPFLSLLTIGVMPQNAEEKMNPLRPVTSGDFRVARVEKTGNLVREVILATTNKKYDIKRIIFKFYSNEEEVITASKIGEIDAFISTKEMNINNFNDVRFPLQGIYYGLFFNLRDEKFKDEAVRQKMEKVLPLHNLIINKGIQVQGPISRSEYTDQNLVFDKYDDKFIDEVLNMDVTLTIPDLDTHKDLANAIKSYWEDKLGINVSINKVDPEKLIPQVIEPRNFEILLFGQEVGKDPDRYVLWHSTQKDPPGLNITGFNQVRADRALEEGRKELDGDKRVVHYDEFQKVVNEQTPVIFLYHPYVFFNVSKYISGVGEKYTFTYADRFLDFANWKRVRTN